MATQYTDKDYFALQAALNQAAATQQAALQNVQQRTDQTVGANIDYFKLLTDQAAKLFAPYQALAQAGSGVYLDALGINGAAAQQRATTQASDIFNQQGINAAPLISSIPGWSFNTAANQSASFINSMFGYGTNQPTQQVSNMVTMPGLKAPATIPQQARQSATNSIWDAVPEFQASKAPASASSVDLSPFQKQIDAVNAQKAAEQQKLSEFQSLQKTAGSLYDQYTAQLKATQQSYVPGAPISADSDYNINSQKLRDIEAQYRQSADALNAFTKTNNIKATDGNAPFTAQASLQGNYDTQLATLQAQMEAAKNPTAPTNSYLTQQANARAGQNQTSAGPTTNQVPVFNQPQLQNQQNNELIGFTNQFKNAQNAVNDVTGNTQGALNQILGNAAQFGNTALGPNMQNQGNQLLNRFNNTSLSSLINEASQGAQASMQGDINNSNYFMDRIRSELANRPDAAAEAGAITQAGLDIGNRQVAPLVNRADGLMDRYMPANGGNFVGDTLNKLIDPATGAVNNWINSDVVKNVMGATINSGSNAVQNLAASRGMLDSGQTLAELQKVGTNAAGQYIVPFAGQLANNVLSTGANLASTELQTGVGAAQNMYGLANQTVNNVMNTNSATANNRLNNYYNLLGKGMDFSQQTSNNRNAMTSQLVNTGAGLASTAGQLGAGMLTADQGARANLMGQSIGAGNNLYNSNLGAMTGMSTSGLNFANNLMNAQMGMTNNLAGQYNQMGNQFAGNLQSNANTTANTQNALQQGGLSNLLQGGQGAAGSAANIYSQLGGNVANQNIYGNDIYGNTQLQGAGIEANRLNQFTQLQLLMDQYKRQQDANSFGQLFNGGGLALSLGAMALGGGI
jgi:hypothetical protein